MKSLPILFSLFLLLGIAHGQAARTDIPLNAEQVIRRIIETGASEGQDNKLLGSLGDNSAVMVTKILAGKEPTPAQIDMSLVVLTLSFAGVADSSADQEPRTTLLLLRYFDFCTNDSGLKKRIADTRDYARKQYANALTTSRPK